MKIASLVRASIAAAVVSVSLVASAAPSAPSTKEHDFKVAADHAKDADKCKTIPYAKERAECEHAKVAESCKADALKCDLDHAEKLLGEIKKKKAELEAAKKKDDKAAVHRIEAAIAHDEKALAEIKRATPSHLHTAESCLAARQKVEHVFERVRHMVESERDAKVATYKRTLLATYAKETKSYEKPIAETKTAVAKCKTVQSKVH